MKSLYTLFIGQPMEDFPAFKKMVYVIWALIPIGGIIMFGVQYYYQMNAEFVPYSGKVVWIHIDKYMNHGCRPQRIKLRKYGTMYANGFSAEINGQKTRLIDYVAIGDSVVHNSIDTVYVYRNDADTYKFTYHSADWRDYE
jgi:hypothetical protein